jgi:hypothetical protein
MKIINQFFRSIFNEILIIFLFILLINNYIGNVEKRINADAVGYYDYLPSIFIHHDLVRKNFPYHQNPILYDRVNALEVYTNYDSMRVNKYPCGTALLQLPFFTYTYLTTTLDSNDNDGYQLPFQKAIFYAALFYLFLSIFFLKKTLKLFDIKRSIIITSQLLLVLATSVTHYANYDAGFSHIYSLFAITAFIYFATAYFKTKILRHFIFACLCLGLILLLRQINILIILFIPFLAGSAKNFKEGLLILLYNPKKLISGIILVVAVFFIQCILWYLQTGSLLLYSYPGQGFDFLHPQIINVLFSYNKGLFVYTPILFISLFSLIWFVYKRKYYLVITWLLFFIIFTYIISCWFSWNYGCSFGLRVYVDYLAVFFIPFALMINGMGRMMKSAVIILSLLTIPINIIQAYQYKEFILNWDSMNKEIYWKIFLKTDERYKGLVWKHHYDITQYSLIKEFVVGDIRTAENTNILVDSFKSSEISGFDKVNMIQVLFDNEFSEQNNSKIILSIDDSASNYSYFKQETFLIHFADKDFNVWQTGLFNYVFPKITDLKQKKISLRILSTDKKNDFKNIRIKFLSLYDWAI